MSYLAITFPLVLDFPAVLFSLFVVRHTLQGFYGRLAFFPFSFSLARYCPTSGFFSQAYPPLLFWKVARSFGYSNPVSQACLFLCLFPRSVFFHPSRVMLSHSKAHLFTVPHAAVRSSRLVSFPRPYKSET